MCSDINDEVNADEAVSTQENLNEDPSPVQGEGDAATVSSQEEDDLDSGITKEGIAEVTDDMNAVYREGIQAAQELKEAFDDIKAAFDFGGLFKK